MGEGQREGKPMKQTTTTFALGAPPRMWTRFWKALSRPISQCSSRKSLSSSLTWKQQSRSAWRFRRTCWPGRIRCFD